MVPVDAVAVVAAVVIEALVVVVEVVGNVVVVVVVLFISIFIVVFLVYITCDVVVNMSVISFIFATSNIVVFIIVTQNFRLTPDTLICESVGGKVYCFIRVIGACSRPSTLVL